MIKKSLFWTLRTFIGLTVLAAILLIVGILTLRFLILPDINRYKDTIANDISNQLGQKLLIGEIQTSWHGITPFLDISKIEILDAQQRSALVLNDLEASLSWLSVPNLEPRLANLTIRNPEITVRREPDGDIFVAGINMSGPSSDASFANWLLRQSSIQVINAKILWQDDLRKAPPLSLEKLNLRITNPAWKRFISQHQISLSTIPSVGTTQPITLEATLYGSDVSQWQDWHGKLKGVLNNAELGALRKWIDYPIDIAEGFGSAKFDARISEGGITEIQADLALQNVKAAVSKTSQQATLKQLSSKFRWKKLPAGQEIEGRDVNIVSSHGSSVQNGQFYLSEQTVGGQPAISGHLSLYQLELDSLSKFIAHLPLPSEAVNALNALQPVGLLKQVSIKWEGNRTDLKRYAVESDIQDLGINAYGAIPGFTNLSGHLEFNEKEGALHIDSKQATMDFKDVMRWPIPAEKLTGEVKWLHKQGETAIEVDKLSIQNVHIGGTVDANYIHRPDGNDQIDLVANFDNAHGQHAKFYFPKVLSKDTLYWLDTSILAGRGSDVEVILKGNVHEFPWPNNKNGRFSVKGKVTDGLLDYGTGWPKMEGISLDLLFEGKRMELTTTKGHFWGNKVTRAVATIEDLDALHPILNIVGDVEGPVSDMVKFVNNSPVSEVTEGFTHDLKTSGTGKLKINLMIPLDNVDASKTKGAYTINNASLISPSIPDLTQVNGKLEFTDTGLTAKNMNAWAFGGPAHVNINTGANRLIMVNANGTATDSGLKQVYSDSFTQHLHGKADWQADISIQKDHVDVTVRSNLVGLSSDLPAPLNKTATESMPLKVVKRQPNTQQDSIAINLGNMVAAKFSRTLQNSKLLVERGEIGINAQADIPSQKGILVRGNLQQLNIDPWLKLLNNAPPKAQSSATPAFQNIDIKVTELLAFNRILHDLKLKASPSAEGWLMAIQSREINGNVEWLSADEGKLIARLSSLTIPPAVQSLAKAEDNSDQIRNYPALDIRAESFEVSDKKLGALELLATEKNENWNIHRLALTSADNVLNASGVWSAWKKNPITQINMDWRIKNLGNTLQNLGYPDAIKNGEASLNGILKWPGSPHEFDYSGLSGNLVLASNNGQILKIKPGVGRLFSVLSLQNLPRRLTFDFRDVFSEGFTYDKVNADVKINQGVLSSDNFKMQGPTALVEMRGKTDLSKETQHLKVKVTPYITDTVSLAALAGGPAVAAAAYVAQKILKDPLDKIAQSEYEFVGTWDNPVEAQSDKKPKVENAQIPGQ